MKKSKNVLLKTMININQIIEGFIAIGCIGMLIFSIKYEDISTFNSMFFWYLTIAIISIILIILNSKIIKKNYKHLFSTSIIEVSLVCIFIASSIFNIERIGQIIVMTMISVPSFCKLWVWFDLRKQNIKNRNINND